MIRINKLYSEPYSFEPIEFKKGINLILGEQDDSSNKTNGVGKSLLVEFINFGLMKDYNRSRLSKIPNTVFSDKTYVCLDFFINKNHIITKRSISEENTPTLFINGIKKNFTSIDDVNHFLTLLMFHDNKSNLHPTFRSMLGPLIRDERSEFKSIIDCYDTKARIPPDFAPHLYLFGISLQLYKKIKEINKSISELGIAKRKIKDDIEAISGKKIANARAEVNDLDHQVKIIKQEMELLEGDKTFDFVRDEIVLYEDSLDNLRNKKAILKSELNK
ncbi:TPA: AAA family ATPase, partial [Escherichia coli]|nr:AAA family ATPase [Escherichia coli]